MCWTEFNYVFEQSVQAMVLCLEIRKTMSTCSKNGIEPIRVISSQLDIKNVWIYSSKIKCEDFLNILNPGSIVGLNYCDIWPSTPSLQEFLTISHSKRMTSTLIITVWFGESCHSVAVNTSLWLKYNSCAIQFVLFEDKIVC